MPRRTRILLLASSLGLLLPRLGRAEDSVAYKYEDYREADGRIAVQTQSAAVTEDFGTEWEAKLTGTIDAIAGATPTGMPDLANNGQVPLRHMLDRRKAWSADLSRPVGPVTIDAGFAYSRESDYTSYGWSLNTVTEFNDKNTSLTLGGAGTEDHVKSILPLREPWLRKHGGDAIVGLTQLLGPNSSLTFDLSWGRATGYLSDQYKIVSKRIEIFPDVFLLRLFNENRPNVRDHGSAVLGLNQAIPGWHGALDASYRYYADTFGIRAHTGEVRWLQRLGPRVVLEPSFRATHQSAARFYFYNLDATAIIPTSVPSGHGTFYSSDYRLAALNTFDGGLKLTWTPVPALQLDLAFDRYEMRGTDGITSPSAFPRAKITTAGIKFSW